MVFPKSNLPSGSVPWGREVQKRIEDTDSKLASLGINDRSDTKQLQDSYRRLDATVQKLAEADVKIIDALALATQAAADASTAAQQANDAIVAIGSLDESTSTYKINADNITVGTLSGITLIGNTIKTAASGTRVEISGTNIKFYYGSTYVGAASGTGSYSGEVSLTSANGSYGLFVSDSIGSRLQGSGNTYLFANTAGGASVQGSSSVNIGSAGTVTINANNTVINSSVSTYGFSASGSGSFTGGLSTDSTFTRTALIGGGSTTCTINTSGQFVRTTSSERYKQNIEPLNVDINKILQLEPKKFKLKEEVALGGEARYYAGFIAEEMDALGLDIFVGYQTLEDGTKRPDSVYYAELTSALVSVIKSLSDRIEILEGK